jgi:hypothetical protein
MPDVALEIRKRLEATGVAGEPLSLLTGKETLAELKRMILVLCQVCPGGRNHPHCPFRVLSGLSHFSASRLIQAMPRESCLHLFEMELQCRSQNETPCRTQPPAG